MKCWILLSKFGDICSGLPILYDEFVKTGVRQKLMVQKLYTPILAGVSYVEPVIFEGKSYDLRSAIKQAKGEFDEVVVLQTHGQDFKISQRTRSYQTDQYLRAGIIDKWEFPLVFDKRDKHREYALVNRVVGTKKHPFILVGDHSESSPFAKMHELLAMLEKEFGQTHKIIKLSEVKAQEIFDLIGLYDRADALVTIDTAHVHLSKASSVPKFILVRDDWGASACSEKFNFYCRYSEFPNRIAKMISEIRDAVNGVKKPRINIVQTTFKNGYNLSTCNGVGVYRYHPSNDWKTKLAVVLKSGETKPLKEADSIKEHSIEDCRLFQHDGKLFGGYVVSASFGGFFKCYVAYGEITEKGGEWSIGHIQPKYKGNDFSGTNKNWVPFIYGGKIHFIYGIKNGSQIVLQVDGDKVVAEYKSTAPIWSNGEIRGGAIIEHKGSLLRFFHSRLVYSESAFRYFAGASLMENNPPFATVKVGASSILSGNECYTPNCSHWKQNVIFPLGVEKTGDNFTLSAGINDCKTALIEVKPEQLAL